MMDTDDVDEGDPPLSTEGVWTRKGQMRPAPMPSTEDLARELRSVERTLSDVVDLIFQVVQTNDCLIDLVHREGALTTAQTTPGVPAPQRETPRL